MTNMMDDRWYFNSDLTIDLLLAVKKALLMGKMVGFELGTIDEINLGPTEITDRGGGGVLGSSEVSRDVSPDEFLMV